MKKGSSCPCICQPQRKKRRRPPAYRTPPPPQFYTPLAMPFPTTSFDADTVRRAVREEMTRYHSPRPAAPAPAPTQSASTQTEPLGDVVMAEALEEMRDAGRGIVRTQEQQDLELELERQEGFLLGQESFGVPQTSFPPAAPAPSELPRDPLSRFTDFEAMRVPELKRLLTARGLSTTGLKSELVQRLRESIR